MNTAELAVGKPKDETKKDSTDFKEKLAKFINPFYVSFVIFWVVCNYDFLLILIGKKAILHDLYSHFGYGCSVVVKGVNGASVTKYFACTDPWLPWNLHLPYALRFILHFFYWKVAIPFGLTWLHTHFVYNTFIKPVNVRDKLNKENEGMEIRTNAVLQNKNEELSQRIAELEEERIKASPPPSKPLINKIL